ncbi:MAG: class I SAM-dependent methyltransferase, partial [Planctomycetota bacterium]
EGYSLHTRKSLLYRLLRRALLGHCYRLPRRPTGRLLDVGCGEGWYMAAVARRGWRVCGYEMDGDYARRLSERTGLEVVAGVDSLKRHPGRFDLVTFHFSFEHLSEPGDMLSLAFRKLDPGGRVYLSLPNPDGWEANAFGPRWFHLDPPRHITLFSKNQIRDLLIRTGFRDVQARNLPAPTGFAGSLSYLLRGRMSQPIWLAATAPGVVWSLFVADGIFGVTARKPYPPGPPAFDEGRYVRQPRERVVSPEQERAQAPARP